MSFLRVDGRVVSVARLEESEVEIGSRAKSVDGTELVDRSGYVREWTGETTPLASATAEIIRKILRGEGDAWPFDEDTYSAKGVGEESGCQYTMESATAADGDAVTDAAELGDGSVYLSQASTNLFAQNIRTGTDTSADLTGFTVVSGGPCASNTSHYWQGSRSFEAPNGAVVDLAAVSCSSSTNYVVSVYFKGSADASFAVSMDVYGDVSGLISGTSFYPKTSWGRKIYLVTSGGSDTTLTVRFTFNPGVTTYLDGFQIEQQNTATAWVDGSRASDDLLYYDATQVRHLFKRSWTINLWFRVGDDTGSQYAFSCDDGTTDTRISMFENGGVAYFLIRSEGVIIGNDSGTAEVDDNSWHMWTLVYDYDTDSTTLYIDGVSDASDTGSTKIDETLFTEMHVGCSYTGGPCNCQVDDLFIVPYVASTGQITAWFSSGVSHSLLPKQYVYGDFIDDDDWTVLAVGQVGRADHVVADGANNNRVLRFRLTEDELNEA